MALIRIGDIDPKHRYQDICFDANAINFVNWKKDNADIHLDCSVTNFLPETLTLNTTQAALVRELRKVGVELIDAGKNAAFSVNLPKINGLRKDPHSEDVQVYFKDSHAGLDLSVSMDTLLDKIKLISRVR